MSAFPLWEVDVEVHRGAGLPPVRLTGSAQCPTAGTALAVLDAADGDAVDGPALRAAALGWLPPRLWSDLRPLSDVGLARVLVSFVALSAGPRTPVDPKESEARDTRRSVLRLARAYGWTHGEALALPWPAFLDAAESLPALTAEDTLRAMSAAHPTAEAVEALTLQVRGDGGATASGASRRGVPPWEREGVTQAEYRARKLRELHRVQLVMARTHRAAEA